MPIKEGWLERQMEIVGRNIQQWPNHLRKVAGISEKENLMSSPERAAAERIAKLYELAYPGVNEDLERIIREAYAGEAKPQEADLCNETLGHHRCQLAKGHNGWHSSGASPSDDLVKVLTELTQSAKEFYDYRPFSIRSDSQGMKLRTSLASAERILKTLK